MTNEIQAGCYVCMYWYIYMQHIITDNTAMTEKTPKLWNWTYNHKCCYNIGVKASCQV